MSAPTSERPAISVVISTYQRAGRLERVLGALAAQEAPVSFEVVVVDDGSTDGTWEELQRLRSTLPIDLRPVRLDTNTGRSAGRNAGLRATRGDAVVFTDDDCRPTPGWLAAMAEALSSADVVQGRTMGDPEHIDRWGPFSYTVSVHQENGVYETCNIGYRRDLITRLGGLDESFRYAGEDTDLAWRAKEAGARVTFAPDALVFHEVTTSSYRARLALAHRWHELPLVVKRHPQLRGSVYYGRIFWRQSHKRALLALAGLIVAALPAGGPGGRAAAVVAGAALAAPYATFRQHVSPLPCGPKRRMALLPLVWFADLTEVAVLARASWRHRFLYL